LKEITNFIDFDERDISADEDDVFRMVARFWMIDISNYDLCSDDYMSCYLGTGRASYYDYDLMVDVSCLF
jgi:hypothetical protein